MLGLPIVPSIGNLDFWLRLCNVRGLPEAQALLQSFPQSEERDRKGHAAAVRQWNADLIRKVGDVGASSRVLMFVRPYQAGFHVNRPAAVSEPARRRGPARDASDQVSPANDARLSGRRHPALPVLM